MAELFRMLDSYCSAIKKKSSGKKLKTFKAKIYVMEFIYVGESINKEFCINIQQTE
jgi:hypothetical protein